VKAANLIYHLTMTTRTQLPPVEDVLPHRGNMLFIDRLIEFNNESLIAEYSPKSDTWYADAEGNMPAWIGLELMAQAVAAHVGVLKRSEGKPQKNGVLVGTRRYSATAPIFTANIQLQIHATIFYQDISGIAAYDCNIKNGDTLLAEATLKVFEPDNFQTFLQESLS
jgi:predicted hotdog family 3-hydroxylacyl-ACP dehydratase